MMKGERNKFMKIKVLSSKQVITDKNGKEKTFYRYFTPVEIDVIDENGNSLGLQQKSLEVHFTKSAMKKVKEEKIFSIFECDGKDVGFPFVFRIPKDKSSEEEWNKNHVWIRDFKTETPLPFDAKESSNNTCRFLVDEEETEPVEIVEDK